MESRAEHIENFAETLFHDGAGSNSIKEQVGTNNKARHGTKSGKGWSISHPNSKLNLVTRFQRLRGNRAWALIL
jgi:hypothetical protein